MHCLWCDQEIIPEVTWQYLLFPEPPRKICSNCERGLVLLAGKRCSSCSRVTDQGICNDCRRFENDSAWKNVLTFNKSIYSYNGLLQEMITKWKYRGDYQLREVFSYHFRDLFNQSFGKKQVVVVPIPLSEQRLLERGFNQAESLAQLLETPYQHLLTRIHGEKQSKKTRRERIESENPFQVLAQVSNPVVLIDDIYTTGTTLRHAARLLKDTGCPEVYSFTLARG
ncbi:ComF family protein [Aquibacillus saliphilus]|uniref:ComF family protein n=1 Tax=Aquibacillus saliphilus TaxID=1909422 RepID=UPI001CF09983|nr:ComF family protein [Aquibacillus saliphilus]